MTESHLPPAAGGTPERHTTLDRLPPPTADPVALPPAPAPRPSITPSSALLGGGIVIVALAAAAGGVIWMPRQDDVDRGSAVLRGLIGAGIGLAVAGLLLLIIRRSEWWRRLALGGALLAAVLAVTMALGAMLGAATARSAEPDPQRPDIDQPVDPNVDPSGGDPSGGVGGGLGGDNRLLSEHARASLVDADGDGEPDVDGDGNLIVAFDADGDGVFEGRLVPCSKSDDDGPLDRDDVDGQIRLDFTCDGSTDRLIHVAPGMLSTLPSGRFDEGALQSDVDGNGIADAWEFGGIPGAGLDPDRVDLAGGADPAEPADPDDEPSDERDDDDDADDDGGGIGKAVLYVLLAVLAVGAIAAVAWAVVKLLGRDRRARPGTSATTTPDDADTIDEEAAEAAIGDSIETLLGHPDPRLGIRAAYAVLLDALAEAGFARRSFEAPEEHLERCLSGLRIEPRPMRELLRLFALARYSTHDITERERGQALDALRQSQALLRRRQEDAASAPVASGAGPTPPSAP